jgi:hypothetical protein
MHGPQRRIESTFQKRRDNGKNLGEYNCRLFISIFDELDQIE